MQEFDIISTFFPSSESCIDVSICKTLYPLCVLRQRREANCNSVYVSKAISDSHLCAYGCCLFCSAFGWWHKARFTASSQSDETNVLVLLVILSQSWHKTTNGFQPPGCYYFFQNETPYQSLSLCAHMTFQARSLTLSRNKFTYMVYFMLVVWELWNEIGNCFR